GEFVVSIARCLTNPLGFPAGPVALGTVRIPSRRASFDANARRPATPFQPPRAAEALDRRRHAAARRGDRHPARRVDPLADPAAGRWPFGRARFDEAPPRPPLAKSASTR